MHPELATMTETELKALGYEQLKVNIQAIELELAKRKAPVEQPSENS